jgi:hydroxymethylpyrimidine pyrophosphatase-like HAD family hydrolase
MPGPGVFLGGSFAVGPDGTPCVDKSIPLKTLADTLKLIEHHAPGAWITVETGSDVWFSNREMSPERLQELGPEIIRTYGHPEIIGMDGLMKQRAGKMVISWDGKSLEGAYRGLVEQFGNSLSYVLTIGGEWLEVLPEDTGKERALEVLLGCSGISIKDCAAFGDGSNDVTFLAGCGISIAMANAVPKCLEVATYITKTNDEDGFAWAVSEILGI